MRIAAALFTAKRSNKFAILHKKGIFHTRPCPNLASANARGIEGPLIRMPRHFLPPDRGICK